MPAYPPPSSGGGVQTVDGDPGPNVDLSGVLATKLDTSAAVPLSSDLPLALDASATGGTTNAAARSDHVHPSTGFLQTISDVTTMLGTTLSKNIASQTANSFETRDSSGNILAFLDAGATRFRLAKATGQTFGASLENDVTNRICDIDMNGQASGADPTLAGGFLRLRDGAFSVYSHPAGTGANTERLAVRPASVGGMEVNTYLSLRNIANDGATNLLIAGTDAGATFQQLRVQAYTMAVGKVPTNVSVAPGTLVLHPDASSTIGLLIKGIASQSVDRQQWEDAANAVSFAITSACLPKWTKAGNTQTTVGAAGAASAVPATPTRYLKVVDSDGTVLVIPAFLAS